MIRKTKRDRLKENRDSVHCIFSASHPFISIGNGKLEAIRNGINYETDELMQYQQLSTGDELKRFVIV